MADSARSAQGGRPIEPGAGGAILVLVLLFVGISVVVLRSAEDPVKVRVRLVAAQYGDAWRDDTLNQIDYDPLSGPRVTGGDPDQVQEQVNWITQGLDASQKLRPREVTPVPDSTVLDPQSDTIATSRLKVTWELQRAGLADRGQDWTYQVTVTEHKAKDGRWRVVWTPATVHPQVQYGLVLQKDRALAPRATVLGAGDTPLPPRNQPGLAQTVLGTVTASANDLQAGLAPLRATPSDRIGVTGLQNQYDERLAGGATIAVHAVQAQGFSSSGVQSLKTPLFVGPPETPAPLKLTLDARTQGWAEAALVGVKTPATLVVVKPSTGELLAVANINTRADLGLSAQQPPGSLMGLASGLGLIRNGYSLNTRLDCSNPYTFQGPQQTFQGQVFRNAQGPGIPGVTLGAAIEGGCTTGIARAHADVTAEAVRQAAYDLGLAAPAPRDPADSSGTPDDEFLFQQLGTPSFNGTAPVDTTRIAGPLHHVENLVGEGKVLTSPLAVTRTTATVATGVRQSVRFVIDPPAKEADITRPLAPQETASLQDVMAKAVTELGGSAHSLMAVGGEPVHALAATAGYGTGASPTRTAWCTGYRGGYAFTVMITNAPVAQGAAGALAVAANFLRSAG